MEEKQNEIQVVNITGDLATTIQNPIEVVKKMPLQQRLDLITILKLWNKTEKGSDKLNFVKALENSVYNSTQDKWITVLNDGTTYETKIIRGKETEQKVKSKQLNFEKAIAFAKEKGYELPMTERKVIEPTVDITKLEAQQWFQENVENFMEVQEVTKIVKSYNSIKTKQIKKAGEK